jgi:hypothetical protein
MSLLTTHGVTNVRKSEKWGKELMMHAITQPVFPDDDPRAGTVRPIVEAARLIIKVQDIGFLRSTSQERVDPISGRAIARTFDLGK